MEHSKDRLRSNLRWLLVALTAAGYWQVSFFGFINYDDPLFVSANPHVYTGLTFANLKWALTTLSGDATSYQPLTWLSHQLDCQLFGLKASAQHVTNLWLHGINTVLLFTLLEKLTAKTWRSAIVAALFALHPLHVQSVAWTSERKSLVCALFWLLATFAYLRYVRRAGVISYLLMLFLFAGALLSKPIAVSFPITLLLLDFWPLERWRLPGITCAGPEKSGVSGDFPGVRRRIRLLLLEKVPLFVLSGAACWVTVLAQEDLGATQSLADVPMGVRLENSMVACILYIRKLAWPADLCPIYPLRYDWAGWQVSGAALLLASISLLAVRGARRRPYLLVGWSWYLVTLVPTLGLVQVGLQGMADRYTYVPLTGLFLIIVWEVSEQIGRVGHSRAVLSLAAGAVTAACLVLTMVNVRYWKDSTALFEHAVRVTDRNFVAERQLGMARQNEGDISGAEEHYRNSLAINSKRAPTHALLGAVLFLHGDFQAAFDQYSLALQLKPNDPQTHRNLAELYLRSTDDRFHDKRKALEEARLACELSRYRKRELVAFLANACAENHEPTQAADAAKKVLALSVGPKEIQAAMDLLTNVCSLASVKNEAGAPPAAGLR